MWNGSGDLVSRVRLRKNCSCYVSLPKAFVQMNIQELFRDLKIANRTGSLDDSLGLAHSSVEHVHDATISHFWRFLHKLLKVRLGRSHVELAHTAAAVIISLLYRRSQGC